MNHYLEIGNLLSRGAPGLTYAWHIGKFYVPASWSALIGIILLVITFWKIFGASACFDENDNFEGGISLLLGIVSLALAIVAIFNSFQGATPTPEGLDTFNKVVNQAHQEYPYHAEINGKRIYCTTKPQLGKKVTFVTIHNAAFCPKLNTEYVSSHKQEIIVVKLENVHDSKKSLKDKFLND